MQETELIEIAIGEIKRTGCNNERNAHLEDGILVLLIGFRVNLLSEADDGLEMGIVLLLLDAIKPVGTN